MSEKRGEAAGSEADREAAEQLAKFILETHAALIVQTIQFMVDSFPGDRELLVDAFDAHYKLTPELRAKLKQAREERHRETEQLLKTIRKEL